MPLDDDIVLGFWTNIGYFVFGICFTVAGCILKAEFFFEHDFIMYSSIHSTVLIAIGVTMSVVAFYSCCSLTIQQSESSFLRSLACSIAFAIVEIVFLIVCSNVGDREVNVATRLGESIQSYQTDTALGESWDAMQHKLECCGVNSSADWYQVGNNIIPKSCCRNQILEGSWSPYECTEQVAYHKSCVVSLMSLQDYKYSLLAWFLGGSAAIQIGVILLFCIQSDEINWSWLRRRRQGYVQP